MTAWSHLRRQLIDFVRAPRGLPASSRSCSTCFAGGSIWQFPQWLELSSRLSPRLRLLPERAAEPCSTSSPAPPTVPAHFLGPKHHFDQEHIFSACCSRSELWHIMKAKFKNKIRNTINFILRAFEKSSQPSNWLLSIYVWISSPVHFCYKIQKFARTETICLQSSGGQSSDNLVCTAHGSTHIRTHTTHVYSCELSPTVPREICGASLKIQLMHISFRGPNLLLLN